MSVRTRGQIPRTNVNAINAELVRRPTCNSSVWKVEARDLQRKLVSKTGQAGELWAQKTLPQIIRWRAIEEDSVCTHIYICACAPIRPCVPTCI